ncbi:hypothetical protein [Nocardiopsis baichengensis]|uniref:hypothetical protein n=1 Tax=Nocardiopsis baichengensis TaxID=280240 RepID=UPI00034512C6|nr:hypothetical protein [Nocardiopsis baichengensis]
MTEEIQERPDAPGEGGTHADDPGTEQTGAPVQMPARPVLDGVTARDVNIAYGDNHITNYTTEKPFLKSRPVPGETIPDDELFVGPVPRVPEGCGVLVLVGERGSGRRTAGLKALASAVGSGRVRELRLDWDRPDADRIPCDAGAGLLLDLTSEPDRLPEDFMRGLAAYAERARSRDALLVVTAPSDTWREAPDLSGLVAVAVHERPDAVEVARRRLAAGPGPDRESWLEGGSVFAGQLAIDAPPSRAVEFAGIVRDAEGPDDGEALERFTGWTRTITQWFDDDPGQEDRRAEAERRVLRTVASLLDGEPVRVVLGAVDDLLARPELRWQKLEGGPFAAPSDRRRCQDADLAYEDGTVSITKEHPGIARPLLRHVWRDSPEIAEILEDWLPEVTKEKGAAAKSVHRIAQALTDLAADHGTGAVLGIAEKWLDGNGKRHADAAAGLLDELSVHPHTGAQVRKELANWAKGGSKPERQRAVLEACRRVFGREYTNVALTRVRYVLDSAPNEDVRRKAHAVLAEMLRESGDPLAVLGAVVAWALSGAEDRPSGSAFLEMFTGPVPAAPNSGPTSAQAVLALQDVEGAKARELLRSGWRSVWFGPDSLRGMAHRAAAEWCDAVVGGHLPEEAVFDVLRGVVDVEGATLGDMTPFIGRDPVRMRLTQRYIDNVDASRKARTDRDPGTPEVPAA